LSDRRTSTVILAGLTALAVIAAPRPTLAQLDSTTEPVPGFEESPYDYAALLRIPRSDAVDLEALVRRYVMPRVERRGAPLAGPYRVVIEADDAEYVIRITTTGVPEEARLRFEKLGPPVREVPDSTIGSAEKGERDSRAP
jgi:hypothetical protein